MSLDERPPLVEHQALRDEEPEWLTLARITEAEDRELARRDAMDREACESVEAMESHWAGAFKAAARIPWREIPDEDFAGYDRRMFAVDGDVDRQTPEPAFEGWEEIG